MSGNLLGLLVVEGYIGLSAGILAALSIRRDRRRLRAKFAPYTMRDEA